MTCYRSRSHACHDDDTPPAFTYSAELAFGGNNDTIMQYRERVASDFAPTLSSASRQLVAMIKTSAARPT